MLFKIMSTSRHGKRAPGMTMLGVVMPETLKAEIKRLAEKDRRTASEFAMLSLEKIVAQEKAAAPKVKRAIPSVAKISAPPNAVLRAPRSVKGASSVA